MLRHAYRRRNNGKVFVFTGDSGYLESFADFAKDADLFLADTYLLKEMNIIMPISLQKKLENLRNQLT